MQKDTRVGTDVAPVTKYDLKNSVVAQRIVTTLVIIAGGSSASLSIIPLITPELWVYLVVAFAALSAVIFVVREQPKTTLGADGIYTRWMNRTHYIPLGDIVDVMHTGEKPPTLQVLTRKGAFKNALVKFQGTAPEISRFSTDLAAKRAAAAKPNDDIGAEKFARGKQRVADWVAGVRAAVDPRGGHYRAVSVPRERAVEYLQDTTLPSDVRAGAAIAIAETASEAEKAILLRVSESCASPVLRRVFQNAAAGEVEPEDVDALTEADESVDSAPAVRRS